MHHVYQLYFIQELSQLRCKSFKFPLLLQGIKFNPASLLTQIFKFVFFTCLSQATLLDLFCWSVCFLTSIFKKNLISFLPKINK